MENDQVPSSEPSAEDDQPALVTPPEQRKPKNLKRLALMVIIVLVLVGALFAAWKLGKSSKQSADSTTTKTSENTASQTAKPDTVQGLQLDTTKDYGNKYADGILPVGDSKYVTDSPKAGYIYTCQQYAQNLSPNNGGAGTRGPWFTNNNQSYDINKKAHVEGQVMWQADFSNNVSGDVRTIITNGLPTHPTGTFPIGKSDPAYGYDRNPNSIKTQNLTYSLSTNPAYGTPQCMGGEVGVMLTGVPLFNAFDAGGRDAGAWEVQDGCDGHPQVSGEYHYHTLSSCIKDVSVHTVIGFALDGFPITGPQVETNNYLTTSDLDECHGLTSEIKLDDKTVTMYHYVMTEDFPYSVSCFRAHASNPPGQQGGGQGQGQPPRH